MPEKNRTVLFADDDPEDQELLEEAILELEPLTQLHKVANGREALDYLEKCRDNELPSLIILDYKMPIMNAPDVLGYLLQNPRYHTISKAVWSSSRQAQYAQNCLEKGAHFYYEKPFNAAQLKILANGLLDLLKGNVQVEHRPLI